MDIVERLKARDIEWDNANAIAIEFTADDALLMQDAAAEIEQLKADHIAAHRMSCSTILFVEERLAESEISKNGAYRERNHLVAVLAHLFPSGVRRTDIPGWDPDWHGCVYIDLPTGQISYHFHDSEIHLFQHLPLYTKEWDGHDKVIVHERIAALKGPFEVKQARHFDKWQ